MLAVIEWVLQLPEGRGEVPEGAGEEKAVGETERLNDLNTVQSLNYERGSFKVILPSKFLP